MKNKISSTIKDIIKESKYEKLALADEIGITVQGLYKWLKKEDTDWNMDSLLILSQILDFQVIINKGDIKIMRNDVKEPIVKEFKVYEIYEDLGDYSIVNLYTPNSNLNYDEVPTLLEDDFFIFTSEADCKRAFENNNPIKMYGLLNNKTNELQNSRTIDIYPYKAKAYYYYSLADNLNKTDDNYEIVEVFDNLQILKAGLYIEQVNGNWELVSHTPEKNVDGLNGFILIDTKTSEVVSWADNLRYLYESIESVDLMPNRYFDINRNEIFVNDILIKKGITPENDFMYEQDYMDNRPVNKYFRKHESIRVEESFDDLVFNLKGLEYRLSELDLLMWEKVIDFDKY